MSKVVGRILAIATAPLTLIDRDLGNFVRQVGFAAIGFSLGGPTGAAIGSALASGIAALDAPPVKPDPGTVTNVKTPQPPRTELLGRRRLYGKSILFELSGGRSTVDVYAFANGPVDGYEQIYLNDDKVTLTGDTVNDVDDGRYSGDHVHIGLTLGPVPNVAFPFIVNELPGIWTTAHRGDGVVTGYLLKEPVKQTDFIKVYPQGDNVGLSAVFRGRLCFDPRTGQTAYTENPILHLMWYLTTYRGYDYNRRFLPTIQYWIDAANVCDEAVPLKDGTTEKRYRACIAFDATALPKEVIASICETADVWFAPRGDGALIVYAGKLYAPTVSIGADDIIAYNLPYGVEPDQRVDQLTVSYVSELHDWATVETTPWGGEAGAVAIDNFAPQTPSYSQNRRLAKRYFSRANQPNRGSVTTNLSGLKMRGQRYINLTIAEAGYTFFSGVVEIKSVRRDFVAGGLSFDWIAIDPNIDAWNPATEEGDPAPVGDSVAPQPVATPAIASATAALGEDGQSARITINVAGVYDRQDLIWYARWKTHSQSVWNQNEYPDVDAGAMVQIVTALVPTNSMIDVEVAYSQGDGRISDWSNLFTVDTTTAYLVPAQVSNASASKTSPTSIVVSWRNPLSASFNSVKIYRGAGGSAFSAASLIATMTGAKGENMSYTDGALAEGSYRYFVTALNMSGGEGSPVTVAPDITLP